MDEAERKAKHAAYMREYTRKNREKLNAQRKARREALPLEERERRLAQGRARNNRWAAKDPDHARELARERAIVHRDKDRDAYNAYMRVQNRAAYRRDPERARRQAAESRERAKAADPEGFKERQRIATAKYRAKSETKALRRIEGRLRYNRERDAPGTYDAIALEARWDYYGGRCWMCREPADTVDHVKPLSRGGSNWPANLRPSCGSCNFRKPDRWPFVKE